MEIRNTEKFTVNYAHIERQKNSAIPKLQRMLNESNLVRRRPG